MGVFGLGLGFSWGLVGGLAGFIGGAGLVVGVLPLRNFSEVRLRSFSPAEDEVALDLIELGVVWVSHPNNPALAGVDTGDGAHLYPSPVRDVGGGCHEGITGFPPPSSFFSPPPPASFGPPSAFFSRPFSVGGGDGL